MGVSAATLCTALFKRGLRNQFIQDVRPLNPGLPNMVGQAFTLRYIPAREDLNPITVFQDRGHPQRGGGGMPAGAVFVIDSRKDARAASAGGILVTPADEARRGWRGDGRRFSATRPRSRRCRSRPTTAARARRPT